MAYSKTDYYLYVLFDKAVMPVNLTGNRINLNRNMRRHLFVPMLLAGLAVGGNAAAQLSGNPDKFLGNITTRYQVDYGDEKYYTLWNQITPENESKWSSVQGGGRSSFSWGGVDNAYNYAKQHKFPFKFHCFIWGSQYPSWIESLTPEERYKAIVAWMDAAKKRYPDLQLIDVVNEALPGHQSGTHFFEEALGGSGKSGYDWIVKAFELAYERWPDAILIYNDFNTFQWNTDDYIALVTAIRDAGAPVDAYGCQSHDCTDIDFTSFKSAMTKLQNSIKMPMYSTEYDIGTSDDNLQLQRYKEQIPYMWESDYCAGITLWGYIYGTTWTTDGNSGIIKDGKDRPAMKWLREYMATDVAKNAKSPFRNFRKEASIYVGSASTVRMEKNTEARIRIRASLASKTIDHIDFYIDGKLTDAPIKEKDGEYYVTFTPEKAGKYSLKAVVVDTEGTEYERLSSITATNPRSAFKGDIAIPGTLEAENFDKGDEGVTYHDSNPSKEGDGSGYRTDGGVDVVRGNGGYAIGYTNSGEWMEYTVDVKEPGLYSYDAVASAGTDNASFSFSLMSDDGAATQLASVAVPKTADNDWSKYTTIHGRLSKNLKAGRQIIRISITGASCNVDKIVFKHVDLNEDMKLSIASSPAKATVNENVTIRVDVTADTSKVAYVNLYAGNILKAKLTSAPYEYTYKPAASGTVSLTAVAVDENGKQSAMKAFSLTVNNKRVPYRTINLPGVMQIEDFDKGGEGLSFHDSDSKNEGDANYRTDGGGVDLVKGNGGTAIGYTASGEWLEYTVNVKTGGKYKCEATVSSGTTGSGFSISLREGDALTKLVTMSVPQTANNSWDTYKVISGTLARELTEGQHVIRVAITGSSCNIDKLNFICTQPTGVDEVAGAAGATYRAYTVSGAFMGEFTAKDNSDIPGRLLELTGKGGIYIIRNLNTDESKLQLAW